MDSADDRARSDLRERAEADGIEFFLAMFVDLHGKPCAKAIPSSSFDLLMDNTRPLAKLVIAACELTK